MCPYGTPCGWCSKWDKKCDEKIKEENIAPCYHCDAYEYGDPKCPTCKKENYKYFERKK